MGEGELEVKNDLTVCCWAWGTKYDDSYFRKLAKGVARNLKQDFKFRIFSPENRDMPLTKIPGCFARLRMFDPRWQQENGVTGRLVCLDVDSVVTGNLDPLFDRDEDLVILHGANSSNPCKFNGSVMMLRAGKHPEIWHDFDRSKIHEIPHYEFPDDQGWIWHKVPDAAGWKAGPESGIYAFQKPGWPKGDELPKDARYVVFPGWRDPTKFANLKWIRDNWKI